MECTSKYRNKVTEYIKKNFNNFNIHIGIAGCDGGIGRTTIQKKYYDKMFRSKIVITCNPHNWEGDYRLFEALATGALIFVDKMITPVINPFVNKKHLIYYDVLNLEELKKNIIYYLKNNSERNIISENGYKYACKYHRASNRIDEILSHLV